MQDFPETRPSLLVRVQQDDREAWDEFCTIYRPLIYRLARRRGWQDADAQDLTQQVLMKISAALPTFSPDAARARFRTWLGTVCRNALVDALRRVRHDGSPAEPELRMADAVCDEASFTAEMALEHRRQVFRWAAGQAADRFAPATWSAFWSTAVEHRSVAEVARELGLTSGAVYTARSRVMRFLRAKVQEYDHDEV